MSLARASKTEPPDDVLVRLLATLRLRGGRYACSDLGAPWAIRWSERRGSMYHFVERGSCRIESGSVRLTLGAGDLVVLPRASEHLIADGPAKHVATVDFDDQPTVEVVRRGNHGTRTVLICGEMHIGASGHPLVQALPPLLHVAAADGHRSLTRQRWLRSSLEFLASEAASGGPGASAIVSGLAEVLFVEALRVHMRRRGDVSGVLAGLIDASLAPALAAIHREPARPHTVASLARLVAMSRSAFAQRFVEVVGEPPMGHLTRARMLAAAEALRAAPRKTIASVASDVGYASEASFTRAFSRVMGETPARFRAASV